MTSSSQVLPIKRNVLAAVATLTIVCGVSAATGVASAASPQCAVRCISVFSSELGSYDQPNFVEAILGDGGARIGQPVGLKKANKFDPTEDIKPDAPSPMATVADFFAARAGVRRGEQALRPPASRATAICAVRHRHRPLRRLGQRQAERGTHLAAVQR